MLQSAVKCDKVENSLVNDKTHTIYLLRYKCIMSVSECVELECNMAYIHCLLPNYKRIVYHNYDYLPDSL